MSYSQKYAIIAPLDSTMQTQTFNASNWPLHVTLVDTFAITCSANELIEHFEACVRAHRPFTSVATEDTNFGPNQDVPVTLIERTHQLLQLHLDLVAMLERLGLQLNDSHYAKDGFRPHITIQPHDRSHLGDTIMFNTLALVDMFPNDDPQQRIILSQITLSAIE